MPETKNISRYEFRQAIVNRAWTDEGFAAQLRKDPRKAVIEMLGVQIPDDLKLQIFEEDEKTMWVPIHAHPTNFTQDELSDDQLAAAAGGTSAYNPTLGNCGQTLQTPPASRVGVLFAFNQQNAYNPSVAMC